MWSSMQLIWLGILSFGFLPIVIFLGRVSLLILLMLLMMRVATSLGVRRGLPNWVSTHNLLWRECERSSDNVAARLAVIPLVQEARGLDAGPRLVQKLVGFGDNRTSKIVAKIAEEEVAHVAVGLY
ncbi:hypothetical protein L195_g047274, partial [Trifolium pratense]